MLFPNVLGITIQYYNRSTIYYGIRFTIRAKRRNPSRSFRVGCVNSKRNRRQERTPVGGLSFFRPVGYTRLKPVGELVQGQRPLQALITFLNTAYLHSLNFSALRLPAFTLAKYSL